MPSDSSTVVPDIIITANAAGGWDIALNEDTLPKLIVNRGYFVELNAGATSKESQGWLKEKLADAHWLIRALDQRQKTILKTAAEIVKQQDGFFRRGVSELRPLTLREVAEASGFTLAKGQVLAPQAGRILALHVSAGEKPGAAGIATLGATDRMEAELEVYQQDMTGPTVLVMGAEGKGMRRLTREHCDFLVKLPMAGSVSSLNVSVATGVCLFEAVRQRQAKRKA